MGIVVGDGLLKLVTRQNVKLGFRVMPNAAGHYWNTGPCMAKSRYPPSSMTTIQKMECSQVQAFCLLKCSSALFLSLSLSKCACTYTKSLVYLSVQSKK